MVDRITFFKSYYDAMADLPADTFKEIMDAVFGYVFYDREPENLSAIAKGYFILMKPNLDSSLKKSASGKQGGAADKHPASKSEASDRQSVSKSETSDKQALSNIEIEEEVKVEDKEKIEKKKPTPQRHKHGRFGHVLLTDQQYSDLSQKHGGEKTEAAIQAVDNYCEQNGKSYKNYALVLERWGYEAATRQTARSGAAGSKNKFGIESHNYDFDDLEKKLIGG